MRIGITMIFLALLSPVVLSQDKEEKKEDPPKKGSGGVVRVFERLEVQNNLKQLHLAYLQCVEDYKKGPAKQEELAKYYENNAQINEMLTSKWVTIFYNVSGNQLRADPTFLLAFETNPDRRGQRMVLRCNGGIESMNDDVFKKAPKVGK